jgi:putative endonuclease
MPDPGKRLEPGIPPSVRSASFDTEQKFDEEATHAHPSLRAAGEAIQLPAPMKQPAVYITASRRNGTLHTGPTSNLVQRAHQPREGSIPGFTARYGCKLPVRHEVHETMQSAVPCRKQIKGGSRGTKLALIEALDPNWHDLFEEIV